jgi:hypothetical protein
MQRAPGHVSDREHSIKTANTRDKLEMSQLPPPFFSEPARALHVDATDDAFTGPDRLARETAAVTVTRNDAVMADTLGRGWRSGAPDELLAGLLMTYASAHHLDPDEARAIAAAAHFVRAALVEGHQDPVSLLHYVGACVAGAIGEALSTVQADDEPCWCAACIAQAASLN